MKRLNRQLKKKKQKISKTEKQIKIDEKTKNEF